MNPFHRRSVLLSLTLLGFCLVVVAKAFVTPTCVKSIGTRWTRISIQLSSRSSCIDLQQRRFANQYKTNQLHRERCRPLGGISGSESRETERRRGILVLLTVPLAWGTFEPVVRFIYAIDPPIPGLLFSPGYYLVAATALGLLSILSSPPSDQTENHTEGLGLPIRGGVELGTYLFIGNSLQVLGLKTLNSDQVAFLIQLTTIFVPLVQGIAARNIFATPLRTWIACLIALGGVGVMELDGNENPLSHDDATLSPELLVIGSALAYTFHCIRLERYSKQTRAVSLAACKSTTETVLSVLLVSGLLWYSSHYDDSNHNPNFLEDFALESGQEISLFLAIFTQKLQDGAIPPDVLIPAVGAVLWTGLVTCAYTIYAQSYGQARVKPSDANLIYTFQPVWTSVIAFFLLGETLGPSGFVGGALIGLAVYTVISSEPAAQQDEE